MTSKTTLGEELYRIHLQRFNKEERQPDDFDHEAPHHAERTIGEELWRVHCQRSLGQENEPETPSVARTLELRNRNVVYH